MWGERDWESNHTEYRGSAVREFVAEYIMGKEFGEVKDVWGQ